MRPDNQKVHLPDVSRTAHFSSSWTENLFFVLHKGGNFFGRSMEEEEGIWGLGKSWWLASICFWPQSAWILMDPFPWNLPSPASPQFFDKTMRGRKTCTNTYKNWLGKRHHKNEPTMGRGQHLPSHRRSQSIPYGCRKRLLDKMGWWSPPGNLTWIHGGRRGDPRARKTHPVAS